MTDKTSINEVALLDSKTARIFEHKKQRNLPLTAEVIKLWETESRACLVSFNTKDGYEIRYYDISGIVEVRHIHYSAKLYIKNSMDSYLVEYEYQDEDDKPESYPSFGEALKRAKELAIL